MKHGWSDARSLFLSDLHLGWKYSKLGFLPELLAEANPEYLYLVGDTFEGVAADHSNSSSLEIREVVHAIDRLKSNGTNVTLIPGNHDWELAERATYLAWNISSFAIHTSQRGARYLVTHGDVFDNNQLSRSNPNWHALGGWIYPNLVWAGDCLLRHGINPSGDTLHWCTRWKGLSKRAERHISDFQAFMVHLARCYQCDGVICGHIHLPASKLVDETWYWNCGDWIEHQSCVFEKRSGELAMIPDVGVEMRMNQLSVA